MNTNFFDPSILKLFFKLDALILIRKYHMQGKYLK
jgi:hypothetical protein